MKKIIVSKNDKRGASKKGSSFSGKKVHEFGLKPNSRIEVFESVKNSRIGLHIKCDEPSKNTD